MNTENDVTTPVETDEEPTPAPKPSMPTLSPELLAAGQADKAAWKSGSGPGRWATIGCGLGIVVLIAALFAGSSLMRKTVWAGFAGSGQRVMANLSGDLPPGERMRLKNNLARFTDYLKKHDDPFPVMGEFQRLAREALEDSQVTRDEVEELNILLESEVPGGSDVPYSMP
jgi:hypothetical protein